MIVLVSSSAVHKPQPLSDPFTPPVDDVSITAQMAYGVRKMRSAYTGSCLRVRRASDNAEQDIGFVGEGHLDKDAITSFCGSAQGLVAKIYDQSGNSRDLSYNSPTSYAEIWTGSAFHTVGAKDRVRIKGMGTQSYLITSGSPFDSDGGSRRATTYVTLWLPSGATTLTECVYASTAASRAVRVGTTLNTRYRNGSVNTDVAPKTVSADTRHLFGWHRTGNSSATISIDSSSTTATPNSTNTAATDLILMIWGGWYFTEFIHTRSNNSSTISSMNTNVSDYYD